MTLPSYVGRYEVRKEVATGGFAVVVEAWDEDLHSQVAIKILHQNLAAQEDIRLRFLEEARLLRRIRSPNVVAVHDVGRLNDGRPYFVMDFADRGTLTPRLERKPGSRAPDPHDIMLLVDAVADGLSAIHEAGIVHRDLKPANILFQQARRGPAEPSSSAKESAAAARLVGFDERILVGDLGIAKDMVKHGGRITLLGGTPLYAAPEQKEGGDVTPAADVYAATALLWHVLTGEVPNPANVKKKSSLLPAAWSDIIEQGMALDPTDRFASMAAWRSAVQDTLAREAAAMHGDQPTELIDVKAACPYKGLAAYQSSDASRFFGREALIDELVRRVQQRRVLVVGGASGSGKSSVVRAGLIPALAAGALPGSDKWRIALFTPGRDPMAELHFQVAKTMSGSPFVSLDDLRSRPTMARHLGSVSGSEQPLVLAIDQFEELFTLVPAAQRNDFITALSAMTDPADSKVHVVIVVRADFYGACAHVPWLAERITDNQVLVGPMTESELQRAITEPARRSGYHLERSLVDAIIKEAGHEAGSLPLVAHALVETWLRRRGNTLTLDGFAAAGGVAGAISQTADVIYEHHLNNAEKDTTKRLFLRLVTPGGEGTPDTRRVLARGEIEHDSEQDVMHRVVERLTEERLLTVDDTTVQLAHEALLRSWPRLRRWIEESRDELRMRQRISHAAAEWDQSNRDKDMLYRGTLLLAGLEWAGKHPDELGGLERSFLDASAQAKAESEAIALERERKTRRIRRIAVTFLSLFAIGATLASVIAFMAFRQAEEQHERADVATAEAQERFAIALGSAARGLVESNPLLALSLAAESVARAQSKPPGYDARATMIAARRLLASGDPFLVGSPIPAGDALAIALSPNGSLLAIGQRDGSIDLIDAATRQRVGSSLRGHKGGIEHLDFAPDARWLASVGDDGTLRLWTVEPGLGGKEKWVANMTDVVWGVKFNPDGSVLATASEDGTVRLWNAAEGTQIVQPLIHRVGDFLSVAFTPDGQGLVAGNGEGDIYGWELPSDKLLFGPIRGAHTSDVWDLVFSPDGKRFATKSSDGRSVLIEFPSGRILGPAFKDAGNIGGVAFSTDGNVLIGGAVDGTLRRWDINRQTLLAATPRGHNADIIDVRSSRDGKILATLGKDQQIRVWNFAASYPLGQLEQVNGHAAKGIAFSADGKLLAAGDDQGGVELWELKESTEEPIQFLGHKDQVWSVAFSPDHSMLASGDRAGRVHLWDVANAKPLLTIAADKGGIWSLAFTPDGKNLITAGDFRVAMWNAATGELRSELRQAEGRITRASLSPDGTVLAISATDGKVRLWDVAKGALIKEIPVAEDVVWSVAFSPDGSELATASSDEAVALWDVTTGRRQAIFAGQTGGATDVAYLHDGATIAAADRSGQIHLWDRQTARSLTEAWHGHSGASWRIALHPDGKRFATSGDDGRIMIWDMLSVSRACEIGGSALDSIRRDQYLGEGETAVACKQ